MPRELGGVPPSSSQKGTPTLEVKSPVPNNDVPKMKLPVTLSKPTPVWLYLIGGLLSDVQIISKSLATQNIGTTLEPIATVPVMLVATPLLSMRQTVPLAATAIKV